MIRETDRQRRTEGAQEERVVYDQGDRQTETDRGCSRREGRYRQTGRDGPRVLKKRGSFMIRETDRQAETDRGCSRREGRL